ncbi:fatty acid--CoA ligase family protein [Alkalimonas collagenimarina]|uniref:Fatty acid--CoA ligase family protein n=1 Tax=Alkalimonas collagenimarina TaxID=400390 RepID=A0ABT9GWX4_9GAMM|nr:fatty acid--CoA ligase family protein [Alkalimonas collagenimarina]MDP4535563.1 fatty acid--CoA ligase family protein [Alkalimonas collagenimarina]
MSVAASYMTICEQLKKEANLVDRTWILDRVQQFGDLPAVVEKDQCITFDAIAQSARNWLTNESITEHSIVVINGVFNATTLGLILGAYIKQCTIVPLFNSDAAQVETIINAVHPDVLCDTRDDTICCTTLATLSPTKHALLKQLVTQGASGLILYSSGSTGTPKAILLSLDKLLQRYQVYKEQATSTIAGFLFFDHIGGLDVLMQCLMTGCTLVSMTKRTPEDVCQAIEKHRINVLPTTPTFLNMVLINRSYQRADLSSLTVIAYGSEVMPQATLDLLQQALPHVTLKQTYGMSELGVLPTESKAGNSLWLKIKKTDYKVQDGVLWVKSPTAMLGYLNQDHPTLNDGWLCTGDLVEQRGEYIRILGRQSTVINVAGEKVFPAEIEALLLQIPFVKNSSVWGKKSPITGKIVAATIYTDDGVDPLQAKKHILDICKRTLAPYKIPRHFEFVNGQYHSERFKKINKIQGTITSGK